MNMYTLHHASSLSGIALRLAILTLMGCSAVAMAEEAMPSASTPTPTPVVVTNTAVPPPPPQIPFAPRPGMSNPEVPVFQKVSPGVFGLGDILISKAARSVSLPVLVNMNKGLLEYLLVRTGGKTHESLFRTNIDPTHLQLAFLLIGFEGSERPLAHQGDPEKPKGNPVEITVSYLKNGRMVPLQPENWIAKKSGDSLTDADPIQWTFTGSTFSNGKFLAQTEGSIIAIYRDPAALIDNASPGGESDRIWFVKEDAVPPAGTPVTLTIRARN